jgi:hypothetical protein
VSSGRAAVNLNAATRTIGTRWKTIRAGDHLWQEHGAVLGVAEVVLGGVREDRAGRRNVTSVMP